MKNQKDDDDFYVNFIATDIITTAVQPKIFEVKKVKKITNPKTSNEGFKLTAEELKRIQSSFFLYIPAPTGSGKSSLIKTIMNDIKYFKKRFNYIIVCSPSYEELGITEACLKNNSGYLTFKDEFDIDDITQELENIKQLEFEKQKRKKFYVLLIIDDLIEEITHVLNNKQVKNLFFKRRHKFEDKGFRIGHLDILVTSQNYKSLHKRLRNQISWLIFFDQLQDELEDI